MTDSLSEAIERVENWIDSEDMSNVHVSSLGQILTGARRWNALEKGLPSKDWLDNSAYYFAERGDAATSDLIESLIIAMEIE